MVENGLKYFLQVMSFQNHSAQTGENRSETATTAELEDV